MSVTGRRGGGGSTCNHQVNDLLSCGVDQFLIISAGLLRSVSKQCLVVLVL